MFVLQGDGSQGSKWGNEVLVSSGFLRIKDKLNCKKLKINLKWINLGFNVTLKLTGTMVTSPSLRPTHRSHTPFIETAHRSHTPFIDTNTQKPHLRHQDWYRGDTSITETDIKKSRFLHLDDTQKPRFLHLDDTQKWLWLFGITTNVTETLRSTALMFSLRDGWTH